METVRVFKRPGEALTLEVSRQRAGYTEGVGCVHFRPDKVKAHVYYLVAETPDEVVALVDAVSSVSRLYHAVRDAERQDREVVVTKIRRMAERETMTVSDAIRILRTGWWQG